MSNWMNHQINRQLNEWLDENEMNYQMNEYDHFKLDYKRIIENKFFPLNPLFFTPVEIYMSYFFSIEK